MANIVQTETSLGENSQIQLTLSGVVYTFSVSRGTVREDPNKIMVTQNTDLGFTKKSRGPRDCIIDVEMFWIPASNPLANPPSLEPGQTTSAGAQTYGPLQVWPDFVNQPAAFYLLPLIYVGQQSVMIQGDGVQTFQGTMENFGVYYSPQRPSPATNSYG